MLCTKLGYSLICILSNTIKKGILSFKATLTDWFLISVWMGLAGIMAGERQTMDIASLLTA